MFNRTFNYIGRKLSLPENYEITYWKRMTKAYDLLNFLSFKYDKDILAGELCSKLRVIVKLKWDPLTFVEKVQNNCGNPHKKKKVRASNHNDGKSNNMPLNNRRNKQTKPKNKYFHNPSIKKDNCKYCKKNACHNLAHIYANKTG